MHQHLFLNLSGCFDSCKQCSGKYQLMPVPQYICLDRTHSSLNQAQMEKGEQAAAVTARSQFLPTALLHAPLSSPRRHNVQSLRSEAVI